MKDLHAKHVRVYEGLRALIAPLLWRLFRLESTLLPAGVEGPYLVLCNHNTDLDPVLVAASFPRHMYFVASEHVTRKGLGAWLLKRLFAPIVRLKGGTDASAAMAILRALRGGANVCLFAEGNRSFSGRTGPMFAATGKLVKSAACTLVTCKLEGGYLSSPRWSYTLRRGKIKGYPVHIYPPATLAAMDPAEINAAIAADLYEDAYAREAREHVPFTGRRLAEGLETALFLCPRCGGAETLRSKGDRFFCACGLDATYDEEGRLHGAPYATVTAWDDWQQRALPALAAAGLRLTDAQGSLRALAGGQVIAQGPVSMDAQALCVGDARVMLREISDMALVGRGTAVFTQNGAHYELRGPRGFCGRKYLLLCQCAAARGAAR